MQNIHHTVPSAPNPHSEPFDTRPYSGLAILLNNPAYLAHARSVYLRGGTLDHKTASYLQSSAEVACNSLGIITTTFSKLILANNEASINQVGTDELFYAPHELTMLTGEVMPILSQIIAQIAETPTHNTN